jgi:hypothetical protein
VPPFLIVKKIAVPAEKRRRLVLVISFILFLKKNLVSCFSPQCVVVVAVIANYKVGDELSGVGRSLIL